MVTKKVSFPWHVIIAAPVIWTALFLGGIAILSAVTPTVFSRWMMFMEARSTGVVPFGFARIAIVLSISAITGLLMVPYLKLFPEKDHGHRGFHCAVPVWVVFLVLGVFVLLPIFFFAVMTSFGPRP